jgi:hypothetical protein
MTHDDDDPVERSRVRATIEPLVMTFYVEHAGQPFHIEELRSYVRSFTVNIAPDSPGRILRVLRQEGKLNYVVLNRRQSLYQFRSNADADQTDNRPDAAVG